jgi:hypothetical protein
MTDYLSVEQQDHDAAEPKSVSNHKGNVARGVVTRYPLQLWQQNSLGFVMSSSSNPKNLLPNRKFKRHDSIRAGRGIGR